MSRVRRGLGEKAPLLAALVLASCDLGTPLPSYAQLASGPATSLSSGSAFYPTTTCQPWQVLAYSGGWTCAQQSGLEFLAGKASAVNMNAVGDNPIILSGPATGIWGVIRAVITNCSAVNTTFAGAFYTGAGGTGANFLGSGPASFGSATGAATGTFARLINSYVTPSSTNWQLAYNATATSSVYFRVTTAAGSAQTCDVDIYGEVL